MYGFGKVVMHRVSQSIIYFGSRSGMVFHLCKRSSQEQYLLIFRASIYIPPL